MRYCEMICAFFHHIRHSVEIFEDISCVSNKGFVPGWVFQNGKSIQADKSAGELEEDGEGDAHVFFGGHGEPEI